MSCAPLSSHTTVSSPGERHLVRKPTRRRQAVREPTRRANQDATNEPQRHQDHQPGSSERGRGQGPAALAVVRAEPRGLSSGVEESIDVLTCVACRDALSQQNVTEEKWPGELGDKCVDRSAEFAAFESSADRE